MTMAKTWRRGPGRALIAANGASAAVAQIAEQIAQRQIPAGPPPAVPGILNVRFLGFGDTAP